jgi:hypothetical protein
MLERPPSARAAGSALLDAYDRMRALHCWPEVPDNIFGVLLKVAVEEVGGQKIKSGGQVYVGVGIPAKWGTRVAA